MNGRLYDPVLHRFLQPDNYVQDPSNTQNFNRYGYVLNNPLKYTDPSGEFIITAIIIGSIVGAYIGGAQANGTYNPFKWNYSSGKTWLGIVGGALVGGVSGAAGVYVGGLVSSGMTSIGISGGIFGGAASGAGGGLVGGAVFGGIAGGIFTPKGHSIWTGKALPVRQPLQKIDAISKGVNLEVETFRGELSLRQPTQATSIQSEMNLVPVETLDGGIKTLTPGLKIAENKLIQHAHQWGIVEKGSSLTIEQVNLMKNLTNHIYKNSTIIRQGTWGNPMAGGFKDALFFSNGRHIIVTRSDGTMITILKNAMGNKHFNKATTIWTR
ncbi:RHS repeat-associated core domain protein (fragment) [Capnocytophaga cynodegmi]|uniref:RHS repeat-associated core domain protein n=1 Tax=Capnocytophaga cynodegmi TaxID=28189 RepID=A0A0B7HDG7_9FLAO